MNISEVSQQLSGLLSKAGSLFLAATDDFATNLSMGQIIKGKVLRSYDHGRYLMDFNGHEKVVDSAVPLTTGELIQGRVVGIGDKVELKRIPIVADHKAETVLPDLNSRGFLGNKWESLLRDVMLQYQIKLSAQEKNMLVNVLKSTQLPEHAVLSAVAMLKQGLPLSEQIIQLLNELQNKDRNLKLYPVAQKAPVLEVVHAQGKDQQVSELNNFVAAIAQLMQEQQAMITGDHTVSDDNNFAAMTDDAKQDSRHSDHDPDLYMRWSLLNSQVDGSLSHRVCTLPMWLGDKLIEINIAIYEQHNKGATPDSIKYKKLVFSLELEHLGNIAIESTIENKNIRLRVSSDKQSSTELLVEYASLLKDDLVAYGWKLDEISYLTKHKDDMGDVVATVMQHYVSQDSLNRVM